MPGALRQGGVPKKHQDALRRELLHTYGHEYLITLDLLQSAGAALQELGITMNTPGHSSWQCLGSHSHSYCLLTSA